MKKFFEGLAFGVELVWAIIQDTSELVEEFLAAIFPLFLLVFLAFLMFVIAILVILLVG